MDCGEDDIRVLEFDHVVDKICDIARLVHEGASPEVIEMEIEWCDVVCANCHRRRTRAQRRAARAPDYEERLLKSGVGRKVAHVRKRLADAGCADCGEADPEVLEFDHVEPKLANVGKLVWANASIERIDEEIARCQVRCVNCHRLRTARQFGQARHYWTASKAA
jgi:hypothetical protein